MTNNTESPFPILDHLIRIMGEVAELEKPLNMTNFYDKGALVGDKTTIHNCGTAACIVGYAALDPAFRNIAHTDERPIEIWKAADEELRANISFLHDADFIFNGTARSRQGAMEELSYFGANIPEHLHKHPHMTEDHEDPAIALDFLKLTREWVGELHDKKQRETSA